MLTESEIEYIRKSVKETLLSHTKLSPTRVDTILGFMSYGQFDAAFSLLSSHLHWWRFRKNYEIRKQIQRLLVPEYMQSLCALRNLVELVKVGFGIRGGYDYQHDTTDIVAAAFRLRRHKLIGGQLLRRYMIRITELVEKENSN